MNIFDLSGSTALISGSSRGLGRAIADGLGAGGANLILNGRAGTTLSQAADELRTKGYTRA